MSQSLDIWTNGLQSQLMQMRQAGAKVPELKKQMLERVGDKLAAEVQGAVGRSGVRDSHGRVKKWQQAHVGSGIGYVAIRADSVEVEAGARKTERVNAGALTNWLTNDRKVRSPSGRAKRYKPRGKRATIPGHGFYKLAGQQAVKIAEAEGQRMLDALAEEVEKA